MTEDVPRRLVLQGLAASTVTVGMAAVSAPSASARPQTVATDWTAFDHAVGSAFDRMRNVGGAVAVVSADAVLHTATFGARTLQGRKPVTTQTRFAVGSTTKAMTAALVGTYVDQGTLGWDQKVVDAWPRFRAPTDDLTRTFRVRDLLGMASGLGRTHDDPVGAALRQPDGSAAAAVGRQPPRGGPQGGPYVGLQQHRADRRGLPAAAGHRSRPRRPGGGLRHGHAGTVLRAGGDARGPVRPRPSRPGRRLRRRSRLRPAPEGDEAAVRADRRVGPAGSALAGLTDMAAWVRLQLRQGHSVTGRQVVGAATLAECWRPHVTAPQIYGALNPDVRTSGYAMGWFSDTYTDGTRLVWHPGGFDGSTTYMAFLPDHDLGLVVLNNLNPHPTGSAWNICVLDVLLAQRFGLNAGGVQTALDQTAQSLAALADLGRQARPVDLKAVEVYLGYYQRGWFLVREGRELQLRIGPRVIPLLAMADGTHIMAGGPSVGARVRLAREADGTPHLELPGVETVRRTTGLT